jgi:hypothetical protein
MSQLQHRRLETPSPRGLLATRYRPPRRSTLPQLDVAHPDEESPVTLRPTLSLSSLPTRMPHRTATRVLTPWSRALKKRMTISSLGTLLLPAVTPERRPEGSPRDEVPVNLRDMIRTTSTPARNVTSERGQRSTTSSRRWTSPRRFCRTLLPVRRGQGERNQEDRRRAGSGKVCPGCCLGRIGRRRWVILTRATR